MASLPTPAPFALALSQQLADLIQQKIKNSGGWISFADFMHMALYTPGLGYYSGGAHKFGLQGDFVTAPEISPLFAKTLALQASQVLALTQGNILELGAGTGKLAADLLLELQALDVLPKQYFILEVSDHLRQIQRETLQKKLPKALFEKLIWLEKLPPSPAGGEGEVPANFDIETPSPRVGEGWGEGGGFNGLILANEVLDAIPAHILHKTAQGWRERGVALDDTNHGEFMWQDADLTQPDLAEHLPQDLPIGYITEVCPACAGLVHSLLESLETGAILLIDYGFGVAEYYHPQRNQGTLMCHYQHYAHTNPLINVGLQDITAHVNFSQIAQAVEAHEIRVSGMNNQLQLVYSAGTTLAVAGYVNQAQFLINCGILDILQQLSPSDSEYIKLAAAAQKLMSPAEMGELFKVIALCKGVDEPLIGFKSGDKLHTL